MSLRMASTTIVLILGVLASTTLIISALSVHRMRLLTFSIFTTSLVAVQLVFNGSAISTILICMIGLVRTTMLILAEKKFTWMNHWMVLAMFIALYSSAFIFTTDFQKVNWYQWLPFIGSIIGTVSLFFLDMAATKTLAMFAGSSWTTFYIFSGMTTQLIGEFFTIGANAIALIMILSARRAGIPESAIRDVDDRLADALTGGISVVTGSIKIHTKSNPIINTNTRPIPVSR